MPVSQKHWFYSNHTITLCIFLRKRIWLLLLLSNKIHINGRRWWKQPLPGALLALVAHDEILLVGGEGGAEAGGTVVQRHRVPGDVDQRWLQNVLNFHDGTEVMIPSLYLLHPRTYDYRDTNHLTLPSAMNDSAFTINYSAFTINYSAFTINYSASTMDYSVVTTNKSVKYSEPIMHGWPILIIQYLLWIIPYL